MSDTDRAAVRMGVSVLKPRESGRFTYRISERLCEQFPRFRDSKYHYLVLLHQCHHSSEDEQVTTILQDWIDTEEGKDIILQLLKDFEVPMVPEVLALDIADMLLLWILQPSAEIRGLLPPNLSGLGQLLSHADDFKESHHLLLKLVVSFSSTVRNMRVRNWKPIMQFLDEAQCFTGDEHPSKEFQGYFKMRFVEESHHDAAADYESLVRAFQSI